MFDCNELQIDRVTFQSLRNSWLQQKNYKRFNSDDCTKTAIHFSYPRGV